MLADYAKGARALLVLSVPAFFLQGCFSTREALLRDQIRTYDRAIDASGATLQTLQSGGVGNYQVRVFVKQDTLNQALSLLDGLVMPLPGISGATLRLRKTRLSRFGSFPAVEFDGEAVKGKITVKVELTATLIPTNKPGEMKLAVLAFSPDVSIFKFNVTKISFVRQLLAVELDKLTERMPALALPISSEFAIGAPESVADVRFQTSDKPSYLTVRVKVPSTQWKASLRNVRYYFVREGFYVFGEIQ